MISSHCKAQGEREHRRVKRYYSRSNKQQAARQFTKYERREARLRRAKAAAEAAPGQCHSHHISIAENDSLPYTSAEMHHHISESRSHPQELFAFCRQFPGDPATKVCRLITT
jgi:hypothetical protein